MLLPSDSVKIAIGIGSELRTPFCGKKVEAGVRISIAINTYYPEISGGYYVNASITASIAKAIRNCGLQIVNPDYVGGTVCPTEDLVAIAPHEVHWLMYSGSVVGLLEKWFFSTGGGGPFFSDDTIIDICVPPPHAQAVELAVCTQLSNDGIPVLSVSS